MRLATFTFENGPPRAGSLTPQGVVDLNATDPQSPASVLEIVRSGPAGLERARAATQRGMAMPLAQVSLLAPIPQPPEFLGVGLNYRDHCREASLALPGTLTVFNKQTSSIVGPGAEVILPRLSNQLDYEGELGIVVGDVRRGCSEAEALAAIFGYVVVNDLSLRDVQFASPTVTLGKSFDTHGPFGPWVVTADEIADPQALKLTTRVNGEVRQDGTTADMVFGCAQIITYLSRFMTLRPGTVVTTGTPAGVGHFLQPPGYLRAGDVVEVEISEVGLLTNSVVAEVIP